jgi:hypothetical protein
MANRIFPIVFCPNFGAEIVTRMLRNCVWSYMESKMKTYRLYTLKVIGNEDLGWECVDYELLGRIKATSNDDWDLSTAIIDYLDVNGIEDPADMQGQLYFGHSGETIYVNNAYSGKPEYRLEQDYCQDHCDTCGASLLDEGGYVGYCGNCADKKAGY